MTSPDQIEANHVATRAKAPAQLPKKASSESKQILLLLDVPVFQPARRRASRSNFGPCGGRRPDWSRANARVVDHALPQWRDLLWHGKPPVGKMHERAIVIGAGSAGRQLPRHSQSYKVREI